MFHDLTKRISPGGLAERRSMIKPSNLIFAQNTINYDDEQLTPLSNKGDENYNEACSKADIRFSFLGKQKTEGKSIKFSQNNSNIDAGECMSQEAEIYEQKNLVHKSQQVASNVSHAANFDKAQSSNYQNEMSLENKMLDLDMKHHMSLQPLISNTQKKLMSTILE